MHILVLAVEQIKFNIAYIKIKPKFGTFSKFYAFALFLRSYIYSFTRYNKIFRIIRKTRNYKDVIFRNAFSVVLLCRLCVRNIFHGNALAGFLAIILLSRKTRQFQIAAGMFEILKQNVTADKSGLYRSLAAQCGVTRVGKAINEAMDAALNVLLQNNSIVTDGDQISLKYSRTRGRCL